MFEFDAFFSPDLRQQGRKFGIHMNCINAVRVQVVVVAVVVVGVVQWLCPLGFWHCEFYSYVM